MTFAEFHNALRVLYCIEFDEFSTCLVGFYDQHEWDRQWNKFITDPHRYFVSASTSIAERLFEIIEKRNARRRSS